MTGSDRSTSATRLLGDIIELFELQWQLFAVDSAEAKQKSTKAIIFLALAFVAAMAGLMSAVLGIGWSLQEMTALSAGLSFLIVSGITLLTAAGLAVVALKSLSNANESLSETKREFGENIKWLKGVILHPKTSPRNQIRHASFRAENVPIEESRFQHLR